MQNILQKIDLPTASNYQIDVFNHFDVELQNYASGTTTQSLLVQAVAGSGKCLGIDTPVLLYDGSIKLVQDVVVGDKLMGPDSKPRTVLSTNVGNGELYEIKPIKGDPFVCNDVHVMTLIGTNRKKGKIIDVPLNEYLSGVNPKRPDRDWKLWRTGVSFPRKKTKIDPYLMGLYLGDGSRGAPIITSPDTEIIEYCKKTSAGYGCETILTEDKGPNLTRIRFRVGERGKVGRHTPHRLWRELNTSNTKDGQRSIPEVYLINDYSNRMKLLAGLIDTDGSKCNGYYEIMTKYSKLNDDILFLSRSLGFAAYSTVKKAKIKDIGFEGYYYRISISGDNVHNIPLLLDRKRLLSRKQIKRTNVTGWNAESIGNGDYYGFTLDGDGRFLLGDFTVTHNTTTIVKAANLIPTTLKAVFLAFNKDIATELKSRLPQHVDAMTLNSLGWKICKRYADGLAGRRVDFKDFTNGFKIHNILRDLYTKADVKNYGADVRWLIGMCQSLGIVPSDHPNVTGANGLDDSDASFEYILELYDYFISYPIRPTVYRMVREVLTATIEKFEKDFVINFDEQKWLPVVHHGVGRIPGMFKYDIVIIDEVQDVNAVDIGLVKGILKKNGIVVSVGDRRQAIYGFRGADIESTEKFKEAFNAIELPLSITYRCGSKIVDLAKSIYDEIEAAPNAHEGEVNYFSEYGPGVFSLGDMIICRNNAPLVSFAYKLIANRIPVFVKGRDIGRNLLNILDKIGAQDVEDLATQLNIWLNQQIRIAHEENPDDEGAIQRLKDKYETLMVFIHGNADNKVDTVRREIEDLFSTKTHEGQDEALMKDKVVLSTIHKAKGLEADTVFFLDSFLMYPKHIKPGTWQEVQERNLEYTGVTRAKYSLNFISTTKLVS